MRVLCVEDNKDSLELLKVFLEGSGYDVSTATNGVEALDAARKSRPDIIVSDIMMPEMDGFELCRRIKSDDKLRSIPFVFYTATFIEPKDEALAMSMGASRFIVKPQETSDLLRAIADTLMQVEEHTIATPEGVQGELSDLEAEHRDRLMKKLGKKIRELEDAQRIAHLGNWDWSMETGMLRWSDEIYRIFGLKPQEFDATYKVFLNRVHPDDRAGVKMAISVALEGGPYDIEHRIVIPDGGERIVHERGEVTFDDAGKPVRMLGTVNDVTELRRAEEIARTLSHAVEQSSASIIITDIKGNIEYVNKKFIDMTGYSTEEALGQNPRILKSGHTTQEEYKELWQTITSGKVWRGEFHNKKKNGDLYWESVSVSPIKAKDGTIISFLAIKDDISERKETEKKIQQLAYSDNFTGMPNEASFLDHLSSSIDQDRKGFVASIELAEVGDIIGTFGLEASEVIIYETGKRLTDHINEMSVVARVGPRLFKVLYIIDEADEAALQEAAERLFKIVQAPFDMMGSDVFVNVHMGVSIIHPETSTTKRMLVKTEIAHHEASKSESSAMLFYKESIQERLMRSTQIVSWLHSAIKNNVFELFFQPQIDLRTNTVVGCEALIRWPASSEEWISPGEFIPIAEKAGLIRDITVWTANEACRVAASWISQHDINMRVGINISAEELSSPEFFRYMSEFIEKAGLPPNLVEVEITETALMKNVDVATRNLNKICDMGMSIAIDDFGTGQASLAYLKNFPIDRLKIDRSFVTGALTNKTDRKIIVSIIKLAHSLDVSVIAEGAEEEEHISLLQSLGCDEVQGYFIAKPMPADQFVKFVKSYP